MDLFNQKDVRMSNEDIKNWFKKNKPEFIKFKEKVLEEKAIAEQKKQDENNNNE